MIAIDRSGPGFPRIQLRVQQHNYTFYTAEPKAKVRDRWGTRGMYDLVSITQLVHT